jgi:hypothetical protein
MLGGNLLLIGTDPGFAGRNRRPCFGSSQGSPERGSPWLRLGRPRPTRAQPLPRSVVIYVGGLRPAGGQWPPSVLVDMEESPGRSPAGV